MSRLISARQAVVNTAAVEIKTLAISGRQVTLSVFRQIKEEPLLDEDDGDLVGVPWGIVNYFWGDCLKASPHLHVVWQKDSELRRACVYPSCEAIHGRNVLLDAVEEIIPFVMVARIVEFGPRHGISVVLVDGMRVARMWNGDRWWYAYDKQVINAVSYFDWKKTWEEGSPRSTAMDIATGYETYVSLYSAGTCEEVVAKNEEYISTAFRKKLSGLPWSSAEEEFERRAAAVLDFERKWSKQYDNLSSLDHLFIAV